ncbi:type II toxin-antitoxin system PemK/MazF family toxin [Microbacterium sp. UFMG61]|uniref:type II toxin-antitoxin system PemK/MazF family toxin n=1 Tax=Microbacterium sp. UFMG61 TaxID=2745935 RepID=UPI002B266A52|nr:type II toxin-antitoxin system PemK/MazF family toxin [Microbacterium sp. UFMG61]
MRGYSSGGGPAMIWTRWSTGLSPASRSRSDVREICLARLDKTRPVVVLTREAARGAMTKVTVAPITTTVKGLSSEVPVGPAEGLGRPCAISLDNTVTVPVSALGRTLGFLSEAQEAAVAMAVIRAFDLDAVAILESH